METILEIKNLVKQFDGLVAVNDLCIDVMPRKIHALIGPNGSGKTTTINMINGVFQPTEGEIFYRGKNITDLPTYKIAWEGIGRTFQNIKLFGSMTVLENLMIGAQSKCSRSLWRFIFDVKGSAREEKQLREKALEVLEFIGMSKLKDETVKNLPYGRQKMTELGRTLMTDPALILLDEPAAGLNPSERREFIDILQRIYEKGVDLFLIEHNMDVVMSICHIITVLNFGSKIAEGTPDEIQNDPEVIKAYLGDRYRTRAARGKGGSAEC